MMRLFSPLLLYTASVAPARGCKRATPKPLEVFVSIAPQQFLVDRIGGPLVKSHLLVDKGQDPHSFEPTPRRLVELGHASLYFTVGLEFERQLIARLGNSFSGLRFVAMDRGIDKLPMERPGEEDEQAGAGRRHPGEKDPHIWLSPLLLLKRWRRTPATLLPQLIRPTPLPTRTGWASSAAGTPRRAHPAAQRTPAL